MEPATQVVDCDLVGARLYPVLPPASPFWCKPHVTSVVPLIERYMFSIYCCVKSITCKGVYRTAVVIWMDINFFLTLTTKRSSINAYQLPRYWWMERGCKLNFFHECSAELNGKMERSNWDFKRVRTIKRSTLVQETVLRIQAPSHRAIRYRYERSIR